VLQERPREGTADGRTPRLAVIITCYNYEKFIERAIESVTSQRREDCELVVVDDGSTDRSWDIISRLGVSACRTANRGQRGACVLGLELTSAPFVFFLDADDELKPGSLEKIISLLDDGVAKIQFALTPIDADGRVIGAPFPRLVDFRSSVGVLRDIRRTGAYTTPPTSGNVFRRDVCEILREAEYDRAVDGVILFAAPFMGDIVSLSEDLARYRIHGRNDSGIGQHVDPILLQRDIDRYMARMDHLRRVLKRIDPHARLVASRREWYYVDRRFLLAIASGRRPDLLSFFHLIPYISQGNGSIKEKIALSLFAALGMILPNRYARRLLDYRLKAGDRSAKGLLQALLSA